MADTANAFSRVAVTHRFRGNTAVRWSLSSLFQPRGPVSFRLEWSRTPNGEWFKADQAVIFDGGAALDPEERLFGSSLELFYRVVAEAAEGLYRSPSARAGEWLDDRGWLQAQEMYRLAELNYANNFDASPGCLIKRRVWGRRCPRCTDRPSGQTVRSECRLCWGTGVLGGYYPPVPRPVVLTRRRSKYDYAAAEGGPGLAHQRTGRCLAQPVPVDERDLWRNSRTGEIYVIAGTGQPVEDSLKWGDFVIEQSFPLEIEAAGSVLYEMPLEGCGDEAPPSGECEPWVEPEPGCALVQPDAPAGEGAGGGELPDPLPRPEPPRPAPPPVSGETLRWL